jgi:hypothetical protein
MVRRIVFTSSCIRNAVQAAEKFFVSSLAIPHVFLHVANRVASPDSLIVEIVRVPYFEFSAKFRAPPGARELMS